MLSWTSQQRREMSGRDADQLQDTIELIRADEARRAAAGGDQRPGDQDGEQDR